MIVGLRPALSLKGEEEEEEEDGVRRQSMAVDGCCCWVKAECVRKSTASEVEA